MQLLPFPFPDESHGLGSVQFASGLIGLVLTQKQSKQRFIILLPMSPRPAHIGFGETHRERKYEVLWSCHIF